MSLSSCGITWQYVPSISSLPAPLSPSFHQGEVVLLLLTNSVSAMNQPLYKESLSLCLLFALVVFVVQRKAISACFRRNNELFGPFLHEECLPTSASKGNLNT